MSRIRTDVKFLRFCLLAVILATGALRGDVHAQSSNPSVLWSVNVTPPFFSAGAAQILATVPVPMNGGTNSVATPSGASVKLTTAPTAHNGTFTLLNWHALYVQPHPLLLSSQSSADCTGSTGGIGANWITNTNGTSFASTFNFTAQCLMTYISPIMCASTHTTTTKCPQSFTFNGDFLSFTPAAIGTAVLQQGSGKIQRFGTYVAIPSNGLVIAMNDRVVTDPGGQLELTLIDGTTIVLLQNSELVIDNFVYDPGTNFHRIWEKFLRGFQHWVSGLSGDHDFQVRSLIAVTGVRGTDFTTQIDQSGGLITQTTSVASGTVDVTDAKGQTTTLTAGQSNQLSGPQPLLVASILPSSRSVSTTKLATAFASILNAGPGDALGCTISAPSTLPADFFYETTDPATNAPNSNPGMPVNIPVGTNQTFFFGITPASAFNATDVQLSFTCNGSDTVAPLIGINTLLLSASDTAVPDVITVGVTPSNDGIAHVSGIGGTGLFAIATSNIGAPAQVTARVRLSDSTMPIGATLCETDKNTGACKQTPAATVNRTMANNETTTWTAFLKSSALLPLDPAKYRAFFEFVDAGGVVRGSTSTAVAVQ